ncbi:MAG TPA: hypothetical protein VNB06_13540, partial [Thermoanaerobaculia bacterium]|nr:hypothetical protein [Thermoanaerobaculia bacterium]
MSDPTPQAAPSRPAAGLGAAAFEPVPAGERYRPWIGDQPDPPEVTIKAVVAGVLFGITFGAANAYLGLRAGLTISTS